MKLCRGEGGPLGRQPMWQSTCANCFELISLRLPHVPKPDLGLLDVIAHVLELRMVDLDAGTPPHQPWLVVVGVSAWNEDSGCTTSSRDCVAAFFVLRRARRAEHAAVFPGNRTKAEATPKRMSSKNKQVEGSHPKFAKEDRGCLHRTSPNPTSDDVGSRRLDGFWDRDTRVGSRNHGVHRGGRARLPVGVPGCNAQVPCDNTLACDLSLGSRHDFFFQ